MSWTRGAGRATRRRLVDVDVEDDGAPAVAVVASSMAVVVAIEVVASITDMSTEVARWLWLSSAEDQYRVHSTFMLFFLLSVPIWMSTIYCPAVERKKRLRSLNDKVTSTTTSTAIMYAVLC